MFEVIVSSPSVRVTRARRTGNKLPLPSGVCGAALETAWRKGTQ